MGKGAGIIYRSFVEAVRLLDGESQLEAMNAYIDYTLDGIKYDGKNPVVKALMIMSYPAIDSAQARYDSKCENGRKGGRPRKDKPNENLNETEQKPNENLNETEKNLKEEVEEEVEVKEEKEVEEYIDEEEDILRLPAGVKPVPTTFIHDIKKKVVEEGDLTRIAQQSWIDPAMIHQDSENIYISLLQPQAVEHIKSTYGGYFVDAIRAIKPDFKGDIVFATG